MLVVKERAAEVDKNTKPIIVSLIGDRCFKWIVQSNRDALSLDFEQFRICIRIETDRAWHQAGAGKFRAPCFGFIRLMGQDLRPMDLRLAELREQGDEVDSIEPQRPAPCRDLAFPTLQIPRIMVRTEAPDHVRGT